MSVCHTTFSIQLNHELWMIFLLFCIITVAESQVDRLLEKYRPQGMIRYKSLKCLFTGPPRVGKTTLKKRLLKIITNLISSGVFVKSGGLEKPITVITGEARKCATVLIDPNHIDWQVQPNPVDEAQTVMLFIDQQTTPNQENTSEKQHSRMSFEADTLLESLHTIPSKHLKAWMLHPLHQKFIPPDIHLHPMKPKLLHWMMSRN